MKKILAVTMTAALALPLVATAASAQGEKITVEGLVFLDRNRDNVFTPGENVLAHAPGIQIYDRDTNKLAGTFPVGQDGRYKAVLPKGPRYITRTDLGDYSSTRLGHDVSESRTDADYALRGIFLDGFAFADTNGDGVKQADEQPVTGKITVKGTTNSGADFSAETEAGPDGAYLFDLPHGQLTLTAPDLRKKQLGLAKPKSDKDVDWVTGRRAVVADGNGDARIDLRYFAPKADSALEGLTITPSKDTYTVGEQFDLKFKVVNKGDVPGKMSVTLFRLSEGDVKLISRSDNVTGRIESFETVGTILPGESITVEMKFEFLNTDLGEIYAFVRPGVGGFTDVDVTNQGQEFRKVIKVVEKSAETTAPTTTTSTPASTTQAVAKAGNKTGLASTGAAPLGGLALGALLLAAGTAAFFMARRRRS